MLECRITKYDPSLRDARGVYLPDEWTSYSDIGREFGGVTLTGDAYGRVEDAYVAVAVAFLQESGICTLSIEGLEYPADLPPALEGSSVKYGELGEVVRCVLRDRFWCRLESAKAFLHFGWDYYMYVGTWRACPEAEELARRMGLFVEPFPSPYKQRHGS